MSTYISLDQAKGTTAKINALEPPITATEQAKVAYAATTATSNVTAEGNRDYYAVWEKCGFNQNCKNAGDMMAAYGNWAEMMRNEYKTYTAGHQPASQWGLPEGITWIYVE